MYHTLVSLVYESALFMSNYTSISLLGTKSCLHTFCMYGITSSSDHLYLRSH